MPLHRLSNMKYRDFVIKIPLNVFVMGYIYASVYSHCIKLDACDLLVACILRGMGESILMSL